MGHPGAIAALKEAALRGHDLPLAKAAAKALGETGQRIELDELVRIADRGQEFFDRGLRTFLFRVPALASLIVLCRLERAGVDLDLDASFASLQRRINRGQFAPKPSDWDAVARELPLCPKVRERAQTMLAIHILNHEGTPEMMEENRISGLEEHLRWDVSFTERIVNLARRHGLVEEHSGLLVLTEAGRSRAKAAMVRGG